MIFDHKHYVPVLRWKRGEWNALRDVGSADRDSITPLIELAPKDFLDWRTRGSGFVLRTPSLSPPKRPIRPYPGSSTTFVHPSRRSANIRYASTPSESGSRCDISPLSRSASRSAKRRDAGR